MKKVELHLRHVELLHSVQLLAINEQGLHVELVFTKKPLEHTPHVKLDWHVEQLAMYFGQHAATENEQFLH